MVRENIKKNIKAEKKLAMLPVFQFFQNCKYIVFDKRNVRDFNEQFDTIKEKVSNGFQSIKDDL